MFWGEAALLKVVVKTLSNLEAGCFHPWTGFQSLTTVTPQRAEIHSETSPCSLHHRSFGQLDELPRQFPNLPWVPTLERRRQVFFEGLYFSGMGNSL